MAKISTYTQSTPTATDLIIGTDEGSNDATKNFSVADLKSFINGESYTSVSLSKTDILALSGGATSFTLVAAPGASKIIVPKGYFIEIFNSTPYGGTVAGIDVWAGGTAKVGDMIDNLFSAAIAKKFYVGVPTTTVHSGATVSIANTALTIKSTGGGTITDAGASDLTLKITTFYTILDV